MPGASAFTFREARGLQKSVSRTSMLLAWSDVGRPGCGPSKGKHTPGPCRVWGSSPGRATSTCLRPRETSGLGAALGHPEKGQAALGCGHSSVPLGVPPRLRIIPPRHKSAPPAGTNQTKNTKTASHSSERGMPGRNTLGQGGQGTGCF